MPNTRKIAAALILFAFAGLSSAQQYKWVDKNGRTQYGDHPPPGTKATALKGPPAPAAPPAAPAAAAAKGPGPLTPEEAFRKRQLDAQKARESAEKDQQAASAKADNCSRAKEAARLYESGAPIARADDKGERFFLSDSQRETEMQRARKLVADNCGGG